MNKVRCLNCGKVLHSRFSHDFVMCNCEEKKRICIDGGDAYHKFLCGPEARWVKITKAGESAPRDAANPFGNVEEKEDSDEGD